MIFDTHAHYDDEKFDIDRDTLLKSLPSCGIEAVTDVGASLESSIMAVKLANQYDFMYAAVGVHPDHVGEMDEEKLDMLEKLARKERKVVAIGEIGLDYYWDISDHALQKEWFMRQLSLARRVGLPVIIHSRDAVRDTYEVLRDNDAGSIGGVIHCFSASVEMAREYVKMGFFIGIGGVLAFKNAKTIKEVAADTPIERIVLETDCPYLAPPPHRGKRNCSIYLSEVVKVLAGIKQMPEEEVIRITCENAKKLYRLI